VAVPFFGPPEAAGNLNGNANATPFDPAPPGRFQQVYDSSIFGSLAQSGGGYIAEISFRIDAFQGHSFMATIPSIQINLSTTTLFPDGLSSVFSQNVGSDDMMVFGPSAASLTGVGGGGVTGFHVSFSFSTPFFYDPANGNLLLDIRIHEGFGPIGPPQGVAILDAFSVAGDSVSSVYAFGPTSPTSGQVSTLGLATAFHVVPVPEPSLIALLAVGVGMLGVGWKRMRKHKEGKNAAD